MIWIWVSIYAALCLGYCAGFLHHAFLENMAKQEAEDFKQLAPLISDVTHKQNLMRGWKGCPDCYGSGGKRRKPCPKCEGSGRLDVHNDAPYKKTLAP